ncbi:NLR family CARD domain-containing protein 3-like isoform X2 [Hoplias malabaricus]|uniref:NLR family CARD domain-containing protein 3-like isoform X2 n=1 Tax=Hoplias malabaricus TaxID=27720 RepID=UPI003462E1F7
MDEPFKFSKKRRKRNCVSMKSDRSMEPPPKFSKEGGEPSCVSMKSDRSMGNPPVFSSGAVPSDPEVQKTTPDRTRKNMESILKELEQRVISVVKNHLNRFMKLLSEDYPACSEREEEEEEEDGVRDGVMKITLNVLRNMNHTHLAHTLQSKLAPSSHRKLKSTLKEKFQKINEGVSNPGSSALLNEIYTDLYITEGGSGEVNTEHEVRQIETVSRRPAAQEKPIKCSQLFKDKAIRTVLTKGVAGIGKTVSVQKFILDWAEGKENQDVLFIFPLPFRELNLMKEKRLSLMELLHQFFRDTKELKPRDYDLYRVLFIFDGLDECRLPLDFQNNEGLWDVTQSASVDVLLTNLIKGNLLPSALLWITSRPAAANQIPPECVAQVTEVRGFSDPQKEEYFRKRISDQSLANQIISHIKSSRSLYIMCHIPVFCWISATVLQRVLGGAEGGETPKTLTQMFTHFLIFQIKHKEQKYQGKQEVDPQKTRESVLALGKLAFQQLEKGNLIFYKDDLRECGIDVREVSVYSGVCTQIFREEFGLHLGKVFSFVHLSVQEFLAALYTLLSFISRDEPKQSSTDLSGVFRASTMSEFLKCAVDKALQSENGHLDLYLRFLLGLSLESSQTLLRGILTQTGIRSHSKEETVQYIKEKIRENPSPEKTINLFHCLNELNDHSLVQEVQEHLKRGGSLSGVRFSPDQWSAVAFVLLNSEEELDEFDLRKYNPSEEGVLRLLPVIKASRKAVLAGCNLTKDSCETLESALHSVNSSLKELDLSNNHLQDSGVELLSDGLKSSLCKLETLRLAGCNLTKDSCETLGSALQSVNSSLKELDLSNNDLQDSGLELLSAGLKSSLCKLETLRLSGCMITDEGYCSLATALKSNPSHLREMDLSCNHPGESGGKLLSDLLQDPHFALEKLQVQHGGISRMRPGPKKWYCDLTLDPNTAHTALSLSEGNRKVESVMETQWYPDHPERFDGVPQVLSVESLTGRCYWEVEWRGWGVSISVSYRGIRRKEGGAESGFGFNKFSWSLFCSENSYWVRHNHQETEIHPPSHCNRVGVYLDWGSGTLSFYTISPHTHTLTHLHTFTSTFTEPLYAGFVVWGHDSSVCLCETE